MKALAFLCGAALLAAGAYWIGAALDKSAAGLLLGIFVGWLSLAPGMVLALSSRSRLRDEAQQLEDERRLLEQERAQIRALAWHVAESPAQLVLHAGDRERVA